MYARAERPEPCVTAIITTLWQLYDGRSLLLQRFVHACITETSTRRLSYCSRARILRVFFFFLGNVFRPSKRRRRSRHFRRAIETERRLYKTRFCGIKQYQRSGFLGRQKVDTRCCCNS